MMLSSRDVKLSSWVVAELNVVVVVVAAATELSVAVVVVVAATTELSVVVVVVFAAIQVAATQVTVVVVVMTQDAVVAVASSNCKMLSLPHQTQCPA
jgi:hypothetical protein